MNDTPHLSRRHFGALAGMSVLLTACGTGSGSGGGSATPVKGGTLTYAYDSEPVSWDIHVSPQDVTAAIQRNVFDSLVAEDTAGTFHPWLATSWTVAPDLKGYTFELREDVTFTDGTPFNAAAVKANFDRIVAPATKSQYAASLLGPYAGTEVLGPYTVKVAFKEAFAPFLQAAGTAYLGFYSPKAIARHATELGGGGPAQVGTGPFVFSAYTKAHSATFTRNPAYQWGPGTEAYTGPAHLDGLTIRFLTEDSVRVGALTSGQVDGIAAVPPASAATVKAASGLRLEAHADPGAGYNLLLNQGKPPFDDVLVRQAVLRGINVGVNVQSLYFGHYPRAWSALTTSTPDYAASLVNSWPYDPGLSARLLDQAGWTGRDSAGYRTKGGRRLVLQWPLMPAALVREQRAVLGQAIQADLKKIGIEVQRPQLDIGTYTTTVYGGKADIVDTSWARFEPDILSLFFNSADTPDKGGANLDGLKDAQLDQWTDQARRTQDKAVRADLYGKVQKRVLDLALVVPLYIPTSLVGHRSRVRNLTFDPNAWPLFHGVWLDR